MYGIRQQFEAEMFGEMINLTVAEEARRFADAQPIGEMASKLSGLCHVSLYEHLLEPKEVDENWQDGANCLGVDPDLFFPERGASTREAKEVCRGCAVRDQCLEFALQNGEKFGIWGGMSERERRRIRHKRSQYARRVVGA